MFTSNSLLQFYILDYIPPQLHVQLILQLHIPLKLIYHNFEKEGVINNTAPLTHSFKSLSQPVYWNWNKLLVVYSWVLHCTKWINSFPPIEDYDILASLNHFKWAIFFYINWRLWHFWHIIKSFQFKPQLLILHSFPSPEFHPPLCAMIKCFNETKN